MSERQRYKVFLSYAQEDKDWVAEFASALQDAGTSAWFDQSRLLLGDDWRAQIQDALRQSRVLVLILSQKSLQNPWMLFELGAAVADNKRIIPVVREGIPVEKLPPAITRYQFLRESSPRDAGRRVAETIDKLDAA